MKINELKQKIQGLIDKAINDNNRQKDILKFLFNKLEEIKELETIDRLRKFQGGNKYLLAYLTYKSIVRSNYQIELTKHANYDEDEQGQDKLLEAIARDVEQWEKDNEKCEKLTEQPTNSQLIEWVEERRRTWEIIIERNGYGDIEIKENEEYIKKRADEFLKKHKIKGNGEKK